MQRWMNQAPFLFSKRCKTASDISCCKCKYASFLKYKIYLLKNQNRFKIIAYDNAADTVEQLTRELKDIWQEDKLFNIPGIGKTIGSNLDELFKTGKSEHFKGIMKKIPSTVFILINLLTQYYLI